MDVSVIMVNYNTLELTKNTINSVIEKTKDLTYEIILVDNASTDGSVEFFEKKYIDKIIFIKNDENLGFGKANNKGIEKAKGKYVFLLNSDTLLINNAIKILFDFMEKNEDCGACGGNLYTNNLEPTNSYRRKMLNCRGLFFEDIENSIRIRLARNKYFKKINIKILTFNYSQNIKNVEIIIGADLFLRKNILSQIGIFDEDFFLYHEESELCYRILKYNYKIYSNPKAKIIHLEGKSGLKEEKFKLLMKHYYIFFNKLQGMQGVKKAYFYLQLKHIFMLSKNRYLLNKKVYLEYLENKVE